MKVVKELAFSKDPIKDMDSTKEKLKGFQFHPLNKILEICVTWMKDGSMRLSQEFYAAVGQLGWYNNNDNKTGILLFTGGQVAASHASD
jgi:hypothetical protein